MSSRDNNHNSKDSREKCRARAERIVQQNIDMRDNYYLSLRNKSSSSSSLHPCKFCDKTFNVPEYLAIHIRSVHPYPSSSYIEGFGQDVQPSTSTANRMPRFPIDDRSIINQRMIKKYEKTLKPRQDINRQLTATANTSTMYSVNSNNAEMLKEDDLNIDTNFNPLNAEATEQSPSVANDGNLDSNVNPLNAEATEQSPSVANDLNIYTYAKLLEFTKLAKNNCEK